MIEYRDHGSDGGPAVALGAAPSRHGPSIADGSPRRVDPSSPAERRCGKHGGLAIAPSESLSQQAWTGSRCSGRTSARTGCCAPESRGLRTVDPSSRCPADVKTADRRSRRQTERVDRRSRKASVEQRRVPRAGFEGRMASCSTRHDPRATRARPAVAQPPTVEDGPRDAAQGGLQVAQTVDLGPLDGGPKHAANRPETPPTTGDASPPTSLSTSRERLTGKRRAFAPPIDGLKCGGVLTAVGSRHAGSRPHSSWRRGRRVDARAIDGADLRGDPSAAHEDREHDAYWTRRARRY